MAFSSKLQEIKIRPARGGDSAVPPCFCAASQPAHLASVEHFPVTARSGRLYSNWRVFFHARLRFSSPAAPERPSTGTRRRLAPPAGSLQPLPVYSSPSSLLRLGYF